MTAVEGNVRGSEEWMRTGDERERCMEIIVYPYRNPPKSQCGRAALEAAVGEEGDLRYDVSR